MAYLLKLYLKKIFWPLIIIFFWFKKQLIRIKPVKNPIIILTPGKVGSSSIYSTLSRYHENVFHVHNLDINEVKKSRKNVLLSARGSVPYHNLLSEFLVKELINKAEKIYIIILIRNPIDREISEFFQNLDLYGSQIFHNGVLKKSKLETIFLKHISEDNHSDMDEWVSREVINHLRINIFDEKVKNSYKIFREGNNDILVMKSENLNFYYKEAFNKLLTNNFDYELEKKNVGRNKWYSREYEELRKYLASKRYENHKSNKVFKYFYSMEGLEDSYR